MVTISQITARQILDSRGRPTVEASVLLSDGTMATSSVPSGAINNEKHEAAELRDNKPNEYFGYGVSQAVGNVNSIIGPALAGKDPLYQTQIDQALVDLDGTKNKSKLGANAILAVSQAVMKSAAASLHLPLFVYIKEKYKLIDAYRIPTPIFNLINGGRHGSGTLDFQEFQLVPASHLAYPQALRIGVEFFLGIEKTLAQKGAITTVGLEGGFSPNLAANADALEIFTEAAKLTTYTLSQDAFLGIDLGPSAFFKGSKYSIKDRPQPMNSKDYIKYLKDLHEQYRVFAFEDPLVVDAWADWKILTAELGDTAMIVADDLIATNKTLLIKAIQEKACNAVVIKPSRIGTVTEAIEIVSIAKQAGWHTIMSHRSSETIDDFIADLAVGIGTDYVKFGAPSRGERVAKYNRLLRIEEILRSSQPESASSASARTTDAPAPASTPAVASTPSPSFMPQLAVPPSGPLPSSESQSRSELPSSAAPQASTQLPSASLPTSDPLLPSAPQQQPAPLQSRTFFQPAPEVQPISESLPTGMSFSAVPSPATPQPFGSPAQTPVQTPTPLEIQPRPLEPVLTPMMEPVLAPMTSPVAAAELPSGMAPSNEAASIQNSLNELAQMISPPPGSPASAVAPELTPSVLPEVSLSSAATATTAPTLEMPETSPIPTFSSPRANDAGIGVTPVGPSGDPGIPNRGGVTPVQAADMGGMLPRPVPPQY